MISKITGLLVLSFTVFQIGCATTSRGFTHTDSEVELAQRQTEEETLARLAASHNTEIADAASTLAREQATK